MHGCFDALLVYGWKEAEEDRELDEEWLEAHGLRHFAESVVRHHKTTSIYGIEISLCPQTGNVVVPSNEDVSRVQSAYDIYRSDRERGRMDEGLNEGIGFFLAVSGQYLSEAIPYVPE